MNRTELVAAVADVTGESKAAVQRVITAALDEIKSAVAAGNAVELHAFGTLEVKFLKAREGRNPQTGAKIQIAAKKSVRFKPSSTFTATL